jgi:hypothetical protein
MKSDYYRLIGEQEPILEPIHRVLEVRYYRSFEEWDLPLALASAKG